jgi:two-component system sensor kinase FixL
MESHPFFDPSGDPDRFLAAIVESSDDAIIGKTLEGVIVSWNRGAERLYGYTAREVRGRSLALLIPPDRAGELEQILGEVRAGRRIESRETTRRTKDGRLVDVAVTVSPVTDRTGQIIGAATIARNITLEKHARLALATSEQRWRAVINAAVDGIVVIDAKGCVEVVNPAAERLFGYLERELVGRNITAIMPSPYKEEHDGYLAAYLKTGEAKIIGQGREVIGSRKNGTTFPVHLSVGELSIGAERKFIGILHDLSSRVALEERMRASESRWRSIIDSAVDAIVVIDAFGLIDSFNPAAERLFGYREVEVIGRNVKMLMPSPFREEHDAYVSRYLATGEARIIGTGREVTALRRDGTTFPVHLSVGEMHSSGERKFTGIIHDLSARVSMEGQLREQAAMVRLGEMAAVIAHEVKNPLAGIRGAIQVIGSRLPAGSRDAAVTQDNIARIDGLNTLMKDLLLFARPPQPRKTAVDVAQLVTTTATLLSQDPESAHVHVEVSGAAPMVMADPELLKIVFVNLLVNAAHAMEGRGTIRVSLDHGNGRCRMVVADSGPGIPADVRQQIFTPFFTTKARGTGLGLPTAKRIIEAHSGTIRIECPDGGGSAVQIELPV